MLCLYHANCKDGFGAAWAVRQKYPAAQCIPVNYGSTIPDVDDLDVMIVDFCFPKEVMAVMKTRAKSLVVIDHHNTMQEITSKFGIFDNSKSGAVLTWEYLFPDKPVPTFLMYIQDRDLWTWLLPQSREFSAGLAMHPHDFELWNGLQYIVPDLIRQGRIILDYQQQIVDVHVKKAVFRSVLGSWVPCVNATCLQSEIGEALSVGYPFSATYMDEGTTRRWSLRSSPDGMDVGALAKTMPGGGGHKHAAGFQTTVPDAKEEV